MAIIHVPKWKQCVSRLKLLLAVLWVLFVFLNCSKNSSAADDPKVDFSREVRPIFNQHCVSCHGGVKEAGDFKITDLQQLQNAVVAGKPDESEIYSRVTTTEVDLRMPPAEHGAALPTADIETLRRWIEQGAECSKHWAFEKPRPTPAPSCTPQDWPTQKIDHYVLQKLNQLKIQPACVAESSRWLRRVHLALLGLPPTLEESNQFQIEFATNGLSAREAVVDELLTRPEFGEHWAAMWLDQVRYADSRGLGQDGRRTMWKYRDWVIDAFNRDIPFDRFTEMQIAGDLLPKSDLENRIATSAHRMTHTNEEGGTDDEEFRIAAVVDRINTTWQVWQGITFGCVQCHDHPYDPFRHEQYYQFMSYFNNAADCDLNEEFPLVHVPLSTADYQRAGELDARLIETRKELWNKEFSICEKAAWDKPRGIEVKATRGTEVVITDDQSHHNEFHTTNTVARDTEYFVDWKAPIATPLTAIRVTIRPLDPDLARRDSEWGAVLSFVKLEKRGLGTENFEPIEFRSVIGDEAEPFFDPMESLNEKSTTGFGAYSRISSDRKAVFVLKNPLDLQPGSNIRLTLQHRIFTLDAFPLVSKRVAIELSSDSVLNSELQEDSLANLRQKVSDLKKQLASIPSTTVPVLSELPAFLRRPTHVFQRGLFLTKGKEVEPSLPGWMIPEKASNPTDRKGFAKFLTSEENPLTARVAVNRIWARVFGSGLVMTEEDFGSSGELPSHPELLDDLAYRFQHEMQWSQKKLLRELLLSATFAQSSSFRQELAELDPNNRLLARGPRLRLSAEVIRDQALFVAGLLEPTKGGPPVFPSIPEGVWVPFQGGDTWKTPAEGEPGRYRRSIYTYTKRSIPYPMLAAFDAPSREFCTARRLNSNTPVQALTTLNELTFTESAKSLSRLMLSREGTTIEKIEMGFHRVAGRKASKREIERLEVYLQKQLESHSSEEAWSNLALLLLNLDEIFTN